MVPKLATSRAASGSARVVIERSVIKRSRRGRPAAAAAAAAHNASLLYYRYLIHVPVLPVVSTMY